MRAFTECINYCVAKSLETYYKVISNREEKYNNITIKNFTY